MRENVSLLLSEQISKYYFQPERIKGTDVVGFGNSGLTVDPSSVLPWKMHFRPEDAGTVDFRSIYLNGLLFVRGTYELVRWHESCGSKLEFEGVVQQETNLRMHEFREILFDELSNKSGVPLIYYLTDYQDGNARYEFSLGRLVNAIRTIEERCTPREREEIRFFELLTKSELIEK